VESYVQQLRSGVLKEPQIGDHWIFKLIPRICTDWTATLSRMHWAFAIAPPGHFFVVGDEPIACRIPGRPFDPAYVGIARSDLHAEVSFPITRAVCLVASWNSVGVQTACEYVPVPAARLDELNVRSVVVAHRSFFAPAQCPKCDLYVREVGGRGVSVNLPQNMNELFSR
jgi:hypothetical protein